MGLRSSIGQIVQTALGAVGDIAVSITYLQSDSEAAYDPRTGDVVEGGDLTASITSSIWLPADSKQAAGIADELLRKAQSGDQLVIIAALDLKDDATSAVLTPATQDRIVKGSDTWYVSGVVTDPATGHYQFLVTRKGGGAT